MWIFEKEDILKIHKDRKMNHILTKINQYSKRLKFAVNCFKRAESSRFVGQVENIGKEGNLVYVENYGAKQEGRTLFHVKMEYSGSGFFADYNHMVELLYFADKFGLCPVIEYHKDFCYAEKHPVNGTTNPFEYYFRQPTEITLDELYKSNSVIRSRKENGRYAFLLKENGNSYNITDEYLSEMGRVVAKYLRLQPEVEEKIDNSRQMLFGINEKVLGIHFRGTDFKRNYNGHPVNLSVDDYIKEVNNLLKNGYDKIFVATDDVEALEKFVGLYGEKVVYYGDVIRSSENETVMKSTSTRENHHYNLGLEVLRDMMTLSQCDGLIAGLSQVSIAARIQKESYKKKYADLVIINKGLNFHKKEDCVGEKVNIVTNDNN